MDALTRQEVEQIALLARLELGDDEIERLRVELTAILGHMKALEALDATGIEPMTHPMAMPLRLRDDVPGPSLPAEVAVGQAPDRQDDSFRVPHIIPTGTE